MSQPTYPSGLQLLTKDGRVCGNAIVIALIDTADLEPRELTLGQIYLVESDFGNLLRMSADDIENRYHLEDELGFRRIAQYRAWRALRQQKMLSSRVILPRYFPEPAEEPAPVLPLSTDSLPEPATAPVNPPPNGPAGEDTATGPREVETESGGTGSVGPASDLTDPE